MSDLGDWKLPRKLLGSSLKAGCIPSSSPFRCRCWLLLLLLLISSGGLVRLVRLDKNFEPCMILLGRFPNFRVQPLEVGNAQTNCHGRASKPDVSHLISLPTACSSPLLPISGGGLLILVVLDKKFKPCSIFFGPFPNFCVRLLEHPLYFPLLLQLSAAPPISHRYWVAFWY